MDWMIGDFIAGFKGNVDSTSSPFKNDHPLEVQRRKSTDTFAPNLMSKMEVEHEKTTTLNELPNDMQHDAVHRSASSHSMEWGDSRQNALVETTSKTPSIRPYSTRRWN